MTTKATESKATIPASAPDGFCVSLVVAFVIPLVLGLFAQKFLFQILDLFILVLFFFPLIFLARIIWDWNQEDESLWRSTLKFIRPVPPGIIFGSDLKRGGFPIITVSLIATNTIIFILLPKEWYDALMFFPEGNPGRLHILASVFTCAFLHANFEHLFGNMFFLWVFGSTLEFRVGRKRFIGFYLAALVGSKILIYIMLNIQASNLGSPEIISEFHSLGASGAVSGIMGLFVVRCFFARVKMSVPIIMIPLPWLALRLFSFPLRLQAPFLVGLYFALNVSGSVFQYHQLGDNINYWAHVGGYITCILLGIALGIHKEASEDALKTKTVRLAKDEFGGARAEANYEKILENESENLEALNFIFSRQHKREAKEAGETFSKLLTVTSHKDFGEAISLCREYLPQYLANVPSDLLARIGFHFFRNADLIRARYCLEWAAETEGPWQPKAMMMLAQTFAALENIYYARQILERVISQFSGTLFEGEAHRLLAEL